MQNTRFIIKQLFLVGALSLLAACGKPDVDLTTTDTSTTPHKPQPTYYFGFDLRGSPQEDARQYLPFLKYLESSTGYKFKLRFTPKNSSITDSLGTNKIQFAAIGAVSYIKAAESYDVIPLARGLNKHNKAEYRSYIITSPNSSIKHIEDLHNKRFAFGSMSSTQGHLIPRIILSDHGLVLKSFSEYIYTGSHQECVEAVLANKADACGMQDTLAEKLVEDNKIRILHKSKFYPSSGIAAYGKLDKNVISKVQEALINFEPNGNHAQGLYRWHLTEMPNGFSSADKKDYAELKQSLIKFGMLQIEPDK